MTILKINDTLINLANVTTAIITERRARFTFTVNGYSWHNEQLVGSEIATIDFHGAEAAAIHSYAQGFVYDAVFDNPFVDVMGHYHIALQRAAEKRPREAAAFPFLCAECKQPVEQAETETRRMESES